jgi:uncharacterized protein (DUF58 family)
MPVPNRKGSITQFLDPAVVSRLARMDLKARLIVEGFFAGMHKSPYHGFSVEFAEYRQYMQGDSIKDVDWKVYGKTDRFYIKEHEEETNLKATILLDKSGSMGFTSTDAAGGGVGDPATSKLAYGSLLAASLSYLMIRQRDAVGLCLFDEKIRTIIPHRSVRKHLMYLLTTLEEVGAGAMTSISPALHQIAEQVRRRGLIVLISDLMDEPEDVLMGLKHFRHRQHEVLVFHVLDRKEVNLDYRDEVEFNDMETRRKVRVEPAFIKENYAQAVQEWTYELSRKCREHRIDYNLLLTETPFDAALTAYLSKRQRMR